MSAQALSHSVDMNANFYKALFQKIYEIAMKDGLDVKAKLIKKLVNTWGDKHYDMDALQFTMLSPEYAKIIEEQLKNEEIGYINFKDDYGNICFIVGEDDKERLNNMILSTISLDPKYNKELSPDKFLEYAHDNKIDEIVTLKFDNELDMIDFKNKCYSNKHGFVVTDYKDENGKYVVMALAKEFNNEKANIDFIGALTAKSISDISKSSNFERNGNSDSNLKQLKAAALTYDKGIQQEALYKLSQKESFIIGNERNNNSSYIQYNALTNKISIYSYNDNIKAYGINQEYDLSELDFSKRETRDGLKATLAKYFDTVQNATIYTNEEFTKHLEKDNGQLEKEFLKRRFSEYDKIYNINRDNKLTPKGLADLCEGRPSYDIEVLKKYSNFVTARKTRLDNNYGLSEIFKDDMNFIQTYSIIQNKSNKLIDDIQKQYPEVYNEIVKQDLLHEFKDNHMEIYSEKTAKLIRSTGNSELITDMSTINASIEYVDLTQIDIECINDTIETVKGWDSLEMDVRNELKAKLQYAIEPSEVSEVLDDLIQSTDDSKKKAIYSDLKKNIDNTERKTSKDISQELEKAKTYEYSNEKENYDYDN